MIRTKIIVCPDKFRGTLTAREAASALSDGLHAAGWQNIIQIPLADGGEGSLEILLGSGGQLFSTEVSGPLGDRIPAAWGVRPDGSAVIEMARASGIGLVTNLNDPMKADTRGTGELISEVINRGFRDIVLTVGGSASTDGGLAALDALGWSLADARVTVACDVSTLFVDAAARFAPQKGADARQVRELTQRLESVAELLVTRGLRDPRAIPGSGAAGGLAGALFSLGAQLRPGAEFVMEAVRFQEQLSEPSLIVTGEGRLDLTSLEGKVVGAVLAAAAASGVTHRVVIVVGQASAEAIAAVEDRAVVMSLSEFGSGIESAKTRAAELMAEVAATIHPEHPAI